jgi:hypothetical protein
VWTPRVPITTILAGGLMVIGIVAIGMLAPTAIVSKRPPIRTVAAVH